MPARMSEQGLPVTVAVRRPDGSVEHVRVGTAVRTGDGFSLRLGELTIGSAPAARSSGGWDQPSEAPRRSAPASSGGMTFPNYGRSKGQPIEGASVQDLEFYASGSRRSLADPSKSRWHDRERELLAAIEAELARHGHEPAAPMPSGGPRWAAPDDEPPPHSDDDIPF